MNHLLTAQASTRSIILKYIFKGMYRKAHRRVLNHYRELATTTGVCVGVNLHQSECALR